MSRKAARELAFKTVFEIPFHSVSKPNEIIEFFEKNKDDAGKILEGNDLTEEFFNYCIEVANGKDTKRN